MLILGGSSAVGIFAIQLAKLAGLTVIATTSTGNVALVKSFGADRVIDYRTQDFTEAVQDVDLVLDAVGSETQTRSFGVIRKDGLLLSLVSEPDEALARQYGVEIGNVHLNTTAARLGERAGLIDAGKLRFPIAREFFLDEAAAAHRLSEGGRTTGKIILRVTQLENVVLIASFLTLPTTDILDSLVL